MDKVEFDYMYKDVVLAHVVHNLETNEVTVENYTSNPVYMPFGLEERSLGYKDIELFYRSRCFDENRFDSREVVKSLGLDFFYAYDIVRITKGVLLADNCWIRFDDESDLTYESVKSSIGIM